MLETLSATQPREKGANVTNVFNEAQRTLCGAPRVKQSRTDVATLLVLTIRAEKRQRGIKSENQYNFFGGFG